MKPVTEPSRASWRDEYAFSYGQPGYCLCGKLHPIGPLRLAIHVVKNRPAGEQKSHWDKKNKGNYHLKLHMSFVGLVPVRLLFSSTAVLYHVNG